MRVERGKEGSPPPEAVWGRERHEDVRPDCYPLETYLSVNKRIMDYP